jgi:filamentous hemagglutinin family protein
MTKQSKVRQGRNSKKAGAYWRRALDAAHLSVTSLGFVALLSAPAFANPQGGTVIAGSASISGGAGTLNVQQNSSKAIINWQSFDIRAGETTNFLQPSASAIALNRIHDANPSQILGNLNPNGVFFGQGSKVDVGGLVVSTHNITNKDFLSGNYNFNILGNPDASIINEGTIVVSDTGAAAFVAPHLRNQGLIQARLGSVALGAGGAYTLDLYGDELISFQVGGEITQLASASDGALIENGGTIAADGGTVVLTARAAQDLIENAVNMDGVVRAQTIGQQEGKIILGGGVGDVRVTGVLDATGQTANEAGGSIELSGGAVYADGLLDASSAQAAGGSIEVTGTQWASLGGALVADGAAGGGSVSVETGGLSFAGAISATGGAGQGGFVTLSSSGDILEFSTAWIDASGATGGKIKTTGGAQLTSSATYAADQL